MPNLANSQSGQPIDPSFRAIRAKNRIDRSPTEAAFIRNKVRLEPQTVRIEFSNGGSNKNLPTGTIGEQGIVIYGVKDHPSQTVPDTDMKREDRIILNGKEYTIDTIVAPPGEIQGFGVARK